MEKRLSMNERLTEAELAVLLEICRTWKEGTQDFVPVTGTEQRFKEVVDSAMEAIKVLVADVQTARAESGDADWWKK